jgi:hypothetical protein
MIKRITEKANKLKSMYVTDSPINYDDRHYGKSWFICFDNTNVIVSAHNTQRGLEEELDSIIECGVNQGSYTFY